MMKCKICGSDAASPSHRRPVERYLKYIIPRTPYRCKECWGRFWMFDNPYTSWTSRLVALGIVCMLGIAAVWFSMPDRPSEPVRMADNADKDAEEADRINRRKVLQRSYEPTSETVKPLPAAVPPSTGVPAEAPEPVTTTAAPSPSEEGAAASVERSRITEESIPSSTPAAPVTTAMPPPLPAEASRAASSDSPSVTDLSEPERISNPEAQAPASPEPLVVESASPESPPLPGGALPVAPNERAAESPEAISGTSSAPRVPLKKPVAEKPRFHRLEGIRTEGAGGDFVMTIVAGEPISDYQIFPLKSPPKLVIDLKGNWKRRTDKAVAVDSSLVSRVRLGEHTDFLRVVLDFKDAPPVMPEVSMTPEGLRAVFKR